MRRFYAILLVTLLLGSVGLTTAAKAGPVVPPTYNLEFFTKEFPGLFGIKFFDVVFSFCQQHHIPCPVSP